MTVISWVLRLHSISHRGSLSIKVYLLLSETTFRGGDCPSRPPKPSKRRLPMCRMAASSLEISQISVSVNMRTFMADRMLEYSRRSLRPSHSVQLP